MHHLRRVTVVALTLVAGTSIPVTSAARFNAAPRRCTRTYTREMFTRIVRVTYSSSSLPRPGAYARLWRYVRCGRDGPKGYGPQWAREVWGIALASWQRRRTASTEPPGMYGEWAIPGYIVQCESGGKNEAPGADGNTTSASGYYQIEDPTWADYGGLRYGVSEAWEATKVQQDWIAHAIWQGAGSHAWVCA